MRGAHLPLPVGATSLLCGGSRVYPPTRESARLRTSTRFIILKDIFLKSTHTLRAQKFLSKRIISRNTAPLVQFLAPIRSATAGRALTRRPFVDRIGNRRVTDDFVSAALSAAL